MAAAPGDPTPDGIEANQLANVIPFGEQSPDYRVNVFSLSFNFTF